MGDLRLSAFLNCTTSFTGGITSGGAGSERLEGRGGNDWIAADSPAITRGQFAAMIGIRLEALAAVHLDGDGRDDFAQGAPL